MWNIIKAGLIGKFIALNIFIIKRKLWKKGRIDIIIISERIKYAVKIEMLIKVFFNKCLLSDKISQQKHTEYLKWELLHIERFVICFHFETF